LKATKNESCRTRYLILNRIFGVILLSVLLYSILYSPERQQRPVPSGIQLFFGKTSPSTGLSHSFSALVRFEFQLAKEYNPYGLRIFLFFIIQLGMRIGGLLLASRLPEQALKKMVRADGVISATLLLICFWPFLSEMVRTVGVLL
jgi:hypothetical protein